MQFVPFHGSVTEGVHSESPVHVSEHTAVHSIVEPVVTPHHEAPRHKSRHHYHETFWIIPKSSHHSEYEVPKTKEAAAPKPVAKAAPKPAATDETAAKDTKTQEDQTAAKSPAKGLGLNLTPSTSWLKKKDTESSQAKTNHFFY